MTYLGWTIIIGLGAVAIAFLGICLRCVHRELRRDKSCSATLICIERPPQRHGKVIEISQPPQLRAQRRLAR